MLEINPKPENSENPCVCVFVYANGYIWKSSMVILCVWNIWSIEELTDFFFTRKMNGSWQKYEKLFYMLFKMLWQTKPKINITVVVCCFYFHAVLRMYVCVCVCVCGFRVEIPKTRILYFCFITESFECKGNLKAVKL